MIDKPEFMPEFFITPWQVSVDESITPLAEKVFSIIYWYEKMKDGYCHANNATIAKIAHKGTAKSISNCIQSLINAGYIAAEYNDKGERVALMTLIGFTVNPPLKNGGGLPPKVEHNKNKELDILTSETIGETEEIKNLYKGWLIEMVIGVEVWVNAGGEKRDSLLAAAERKVRLTPKRRQKMLLRLRELGFSTCAKALKNLGKSDWHKGENDRGWKATIEWLFNSIEKTEEWSNQK